MRLPATLGLLLLLLHNNNERMVSANGSSGPPALLSIINRADTLLSTGQFGNAAKAYSEAIDQSPNNYLLYYKRATSHFSLQRHLAALEDFDKVLSLTSNTFDNAHFQKARIYLKEGNFPHARHALSLYLEAKEGVRDPELEELERDIIEGDGLREETDKERKSQLWTACVESATQALRFASHSVELRNWRAECALASGDVESAVGDLSRLIHLLPPSTTLFTHIFRLSYFFLPSSPVSMNTLKQCLHYDPDSKPCLILHRLLKKFDKGFTQLDELLAKEDWRGIVKLLITPGDLWKRWDDALQENVGMDNGDQVLPLVPLALLSHHDDPSSMTPTTTSSDTTKNPPPIPLPNAAQVSPQRQHLVRSLCKAYTHLSSIAKSSDEYKSQSERWCLLLLSLQNCADDVDGLVGQADALVNKKEFEQAVRVLERAFEQGGKTDRNVHTRLQEAKRLLKQSRQQDYYKIVGVERDADARTIKKAYRAAAKQAHPDKGGSEAEMALLNRAYEVLSNPEMRMRFDAGEDPMDPQSGGGSPFGGRDDPFVQFFAGHGTPFGGGSTQFHFRYSH